MAITQEVKLLNIQIFGIGDTFPTMVLREEICFDDPNDDKLPSLSKRERYINMIENSGSPQWTTPDVSEEEQIVQDIAGAIWA